jgi:phage terminase large subunit GpA-like protein
VEVTEAGRKLRRWVQLWKVAGAVFKSETYRFLRLVAPTDEELAEGAEWPHGFVHIPKGTTTEWMKQLTAEQLMTIKTRQGFQRLEWQQTRERNEALASRVYARTATRLMGIDRWDDHRWEQLEAQMATGGTDALPLGQPNRPAAPTTAKRPALWMGRRKKWF